MICYFCQKEIQTGFYWAPCPKPGVYAAICKECHKARMPVTGQGYEYGNMNSNGNKLTEICQKFKEGIE